MHDVRIEKASLSKKLITEPNENFDILHDAMSALKLMIRSRAVKHKAADKRLNVENLYE